MIERKWTTKKGETKIGTYDDTICYQKWYAKNKDIVNVKKQCEICTGRPFSTANLSNHNKTHKHITAQNKLNNIITEKNI